MNQLLAILRIRLIAILLPCVMGLIGLSPAFAAQRLRDGDSIWEVSTRGLRGCPVPDAPVTISRWIECQFYPSTLEAFLADPVAQAAPRTIVYVHGNWMEHENARERGLAIYNMLSKQTSEPIRMILFSWPSERRDGRIAPDVREKANLAHIESYYLADFLKHVPQDRPLSMLGFSFGGAVISGTLQLLTGSSLDGRSLPQGARSFPDLRVSFVAPAFDRKQFLDNGKYAQALQGVERLVNLYNSHDPVLKRFRFIDRGAPVAAGFMGLDPHIGSPLQNDPRIVQYDCSKTAGRTHFELDYYKECAAIKHSLGNVLGY